MTSLSVCFSDVDKGQALAEVQRFRGEADANGILFLGLYPDTAILAYLRCLHLLKVPESSLRIVDLH